MATMQVNLWGESEPSDVVQAITDILERFPEARNNYDLAIWYTLWEHYGLAEQIPPELHQAFDTWMMRRAPSLKTLWNRVQDVQKKWRPDLDADAAVQERRQQMARQGVVR